LENKESSSDIAPLKWTEEKSQPEKEAQLDELTPMHPLNLSLSNIQNETAVKNFMTQVSDSN
jgi:hypothetical protein